MTSKHNVNETVNILVPEQEALSQYANILAHHLNKGSVVTFTGELGTGKTTFIRYIIASCSKTNPTIISPTFNLLQTYECKNFVIWHYDLYRINNAYEIEELGLEEAMDEGVALIEWPEIADTFIPNSCLHIALRYTSNENEREISFKGGHPWHQCIDELKNAA